MAEEKQDRRIRRTKGLMRDALIELMTEKPFSEITAKDITEKADLNRSTFYLHYDNVFGLLDEMENEVVENFAGMIEEIEVEPDKAWEYPVVERICDYIVKNPKLCYRLLVNSRSDRLTARLTKVMKEKGKKARQEMGMDMESQTADYIYQFIVCGTIAMVKHWLAEGMSLPKEEMMELLEKMIRPIFQIMISKKE